jgi:hypothetical protein
LTAFIDALEYFTGILIFTTNRIGAFDEAIKSRIHLTLYFPQFDLEAVVKLWKNLLERLREQGRIEFHSQEILSFAKRQYERNGARWNGREIRNAIASAVALAQEDAKFSGDEKTVLEERHFEAIAKSSQTFSDYLREVRGEDSATAYLRTDSYTPQAPKYKHRTSTNYDRPDHRFASKAIEDYDDNLDPESAQPDVDDLKVQELEIQLEIAKLKRQQKALRAQYGHQSP